MKIFLYAVFLGAIVVGVTTLTLNSPAFQEDFQEGRPTPPESRVYSTHGTSKADYIAFLRRTVTTETTEEEQDLQRRIEAVENNAHWP